MTVVYDTATEQQRSASAATTTLTHVAGAGTTGILVAFVRGGAATTITAVSYGGTTLVQVNKATDTTTEAGSAEWWFAPHTTTGSQTVSYNPGATGSNIHVVAITVKNTAGAPYVMGNRTVAVDNTTSHSVSLTTGYVGGMAFGAFYGGGADPVSYTYGTDITLVHDWDMGAFYSEVMRHVSAVTSPAYLKKFGGYGAASDDVAFAAVYITDGGIYPTVGEVSLGTGLAPSLLTVGTVAPVKGAVAVAGQIPVATGCVSPALGAVAINVTITGPVVYAAPAALNTHEPALYTELKQAAGLGAFNVAGYIPTLQQETGINATALPGVGAVAVGSLVAALLGERLISPTTGAVNVGGQIAALQKAQGASPTTGASSVAGLAPSLYLEARISPTVGSAVAAGQIPAELRNGQASAAAGTISVGGLVPALLLNGALGPTKAAVSVSGLTPTLYLERSISPAVGAVSVGGQTPAVVLPGEVTDTGYPGTGAVAVNGLAPALWTELATSADTGAVTIIGLAPTLSGDTVAPEDVRGHVDTGRRWRSRNYGAPESTLSHVAVVVTVPPENVPQIAAYFEPPVLELAGIDVAALNLDARLSRVEARNAARTAARARQRREEEELIMLLLKRVA